MQIALANTLDLIPCLCCWIIPVSTSKWTNFPFILIHLLDLHKVKMAICKFPHLPPLLRRKVVLKPWILHHWAMRFLKNPECISLVSKIQRYFKTLMEFRAKIIQNPCIWELFKKFMENKWTFYEKTCMDFNFFLHQNKLAFNSSFFMKFMKYPHIYILGF